MAVLDIRQASLGAAQDANNLAALSNVMQLAHAFLLFHSGAFSTIVNLYYCFHQVCIFLIVSCVAFGRDRLLRREFTTLTLQGRDLLGR